MKVAALTILFAFGIFTLAFAAIDPPPTPVPLDPVSGSLLIGGGLYLARKVYTKYKE